MSGHAKTGARSRPAGRAVAGADANRDVSDLAVTEPDRPRVAGARAREIYVHASRLFVEKGFDATSMSDIAAAVKITKAGLYHFVKSKEDLLFTILSFGMDEIFDEVVGPAREVADPYDRLVLIIRNHMLNVLRVESSRGNPVTVVASDARGLTGELRKIINDRQRAYFAFVRQTIAALKHAGLTPAGLDETVATHSLLGVILWTARWRRPGGRLSVEQIVDQVTALILGGVVIEGVRAERSSPRA